MSVHIPHGSPSVSGKFLHLNGDRFLIRGVSYGTFAPNSDGDQFPHLDQVSRDFQVMAALGANTVRTYTAPPIAVLNEADRLGLRVMVGVPWMQHTAFLDRRADARAITRLVRDQVSALAGHPAALLFSVGNEIPPSVVRWYGRARIERFLRELYDEVKSAAPDALLTYVNYPPTEYLEIPFFDVCAFNVFLHEREDLSAYIARLHHVAGPRPLLLSEVGADSLRNGEEKQAGLVRMQLETAFQEGVCGTVVFSWTDEWWRGGDVVDDWAFGVVTRERRPKRVFAHVHEVFRQAPFGHLQHTPRVSVVVCAYNAADTIGECLESIGNLNYPDYEVIVVNDGSRDATGTIAERYSFTRVITTPNAGLAAARNVGLEQATGDIVAYTDADVRVDPEWLAYLVQPFRDPDVAGAGGPAVVPADDSWFAQCVARAPGSPTHVLLDDRVAEHVPGCNCAFRRDALQAIGGFNPVFLRAGDDVDICWRIQARGWTIGFAPAALVWHRHRAATRAYWRQQVGYGEGETWLTHEHPRKFVKGRILWHGHIYSPLPFLQSLRARRIHAGPFGTASFPSVYRTDAHPFSYLPHSGRWQLGWMVMCAAAAGSYLADLAAAPWLLLLAVAGFAVTVAKCVMYGLHSDIDRLPAIGAHSRVVSRVLYRGAVAWLHFLQPFARLTGRVRGWWMPPERVTGERDIDQAERGPSARVSAVDAVRLCLLRQVNRSYWSDRWLDTPDLLRAAAGHLRQSRAVRHIEFDGGWWEDRDVTVIDRSWFRIDVRALREDHGRGTCLHRIGVRARPTPRALVPLLFAAGAAIALIYSGIPAPLAMVFVAAVAGLAVVLQVVRAASIVRNAHDDVATDFGMLIMGRGLPPATRTSASAATTHGAEPIQEEAGAPRAFVGDA